MWPRVRGRLLQVLTYAAVVLWSYMMVILMGHWITG